MRIIRLMALLATTALGGCGTYVPGQQEIPGDVVGGQLLVQALVNNVTCEVQDAINEVIRQDMEDVRTGLFKQRRTAWLDSWGVQMTLNLTVSEKTGINPVVTWLPPSPADAVFTVGGSLNGSAEATRIDKMGSYHSVQELLKQGPCNPANRPGGLFMMQSDLKLREWLFNNVQFQGTGLADFPSKKDGPLKQDVISHQVKFEVVTGAGITPGWKLTRVTVNPSFSVSRTRTHTLLITIGPAEVPVVFMLPGRATPVARAKLVPTVAASNAHLASEIGIAVRDNLQPQ